jgi:hypothetical protein
MSSMLVLSVCIHEDMSERSYLLAVSQNALGGAGYGGCSWTMVVQSA